MRSDPFSAVVSAQRRGKLPPAGSRLVAAFSGGPDSAAMLHALARIGQWPLLAVHVDHGMRPESGDDAAAAARLASSFGVACRVARLGVAPVGEDAARIARHEILARIAAEIGAIAVALGHTADDQLETVLLRLTRGAGLKGLRGMDEWEMGPAGVQVARPLLTVTRAEVERYVAAHGIPALTDPTNLDPAFADRNRIRHEAAPALRAINPRATEAFARLAELARAEDTAMEAWTEREFSALSAQSGESGVFPLRAFRDLPLAIRRRLVRRNAPDLTFDQVEQVLGLAAGQSPGHTHLPGGRLALRGSGTLEIRPGPHPDGVECRICLTQGGLVPSMEREFGNQ